MNFLKNKRLLLLLFPLLVIIVVIISLRKSSGPIAPVVLRSLPQTNATSASVFDPVLITLDKPVDSALISISSSPHEEWTVTSDENTLVLEHAQFFRVNTDYSVSITHDETLLFNLPFKTSEQQNDPRYLQELQKEIDQEYPLVVNTPYETSALRVVYISPMTLELTLKNNSLTTSEAISQIKSWVSSNGGDPLAHKYQVIPQP